MLAVSPMRCTDNADEHGGGAGVEAAAGGADVELLEFTVDDIDFGDFFLPLEDDGGALPDLEVDPAEIFAEFEAAAAGGSEDQEVPNVVPEGCDGVVVSEEDAAFMDEAGEAKEEKGENDDGAEEAEGKAAVAAAEVVGDAPAVCSVKSPPLSSSSQESQSRQKPSKNLEGKKKAKVDWTPELHRRFVQAVEQLGIDKAVPSRILEIMGIHSLTRHNIASHLQKYRSHRKHMLAREVEAASWSQRRQTYAAGGGGGDTVKREANACVVPSIGFPPPTTMQHFRPLHVWGHPTPRLPTWPQHIVPRSPTPPWATPSVPPQSNLPFWPHNYMRGPAPMPTQGTPCMAMPIPITRFPAPPVPGIVPYPMHRPISPPAAVSSNPDAQLQVHEQPSSESIDSAIGDVLSRPWLPLPLGLKPPALDCVMGELQRQGVASVTQLVAVGNP